MNEVLPELKSPEGDNFPAFSSGTTNVHSVGATSLDQALNQASEKDVPIEVQDKIGYRPTSLFILNSALCLVYNFFSSFKDRLLYIFTSGTSGLPKCVVIKQSR